MHAKFIKSSTSLEDCPAWDLEEIALVGRSNAGKSALINALTKQKNLAKVSQTPGKTEWLNFYHVEESMALVDTPGYGYAARGQEARKGWAPMIEAYLENRVNLRGVLLIIDSIRKWTLDEEHLLIWLETHDIPVIVILTKIDRLNQKEKAAAMKEFADMEGVEAVLPVSAHKGTGIDKVLRTAFDKFIRP